MGKDKEMRLIGYRVDGATRVGILEGDEVFDGGASLSAPERGGRVGSVGDLELAAPVVGCGKIVCVGLNYREHASEAGLAVPAQPLIFAKLPSSIVGPGAEISLPQISAEVDFEGELGVVIGRGGKGIPVERAREHILGVTCVNDVSARDIQRADGQFVRAKSLDTFCPVGPVIVTSDEADPLGAFHLVTRVNGVVMQDSSTSDMIFSVAELIAFVSEAITLESGDLIATGTPSGVGAGRDPQVFLRPGDRVDIEVEGVGVLTNTCQEVKEQG